MANLITVNYLRDNNPSLDLSGYSDSTLSGMIAVASKRVEGYLRYDPSLQTVENEIKPGMIDADYNLVVYPEIVPIVSVSAISLIKGSDQIDLQLDNGQRPKYNIHKSGRYLLYPNDELAFTSISIIDSLAAVRSTEFFTKISYVGGWETIPEDIMYATSLFAVDQVARQLNAIGAASVKQGDITISYGSSGGRTSYNSDNINDAESILTRYRRVVA